MVGGDRVGDRLQQHGLAGAGRGHDQAALTLAERRHQVHDPRRQVLGVGFEFDFFLGVEGGEVLEEDALFAAGGRFEVDRFDLDEREVTLALLRRPDLAGHRVAGMQVELAYLRRRDVDVVGPGQVVVVGGAQEAEAVRQHLQHAFREDETALLGPGAQDLEDELLFAHPGGAGDVELPRHFGEGGHAHLLQGGEVERDYLVLLWGGGCRRSRLAISFHSSSSPSPDTAETGSTRALMVRFYLTQMTLALRPRQFVDLRGQHAVFGVLTFQPLPGAAVAVEAGMPAVDEQERPPHRGETVSTFTMEIRADQRVELGRRLVAAPGVSVPGQIDEVERGVALPLQPVEIGQAGLSRGRARPGYLRPDQRVDETRLADVRPADEGDLGKLLFREAPGARGAGDELG